LNQWSHPPGLNRRPADYETLQSSQLIENAIHHRPFAPANKRVAAQLEQVSEQVRAPAARSDTTAAEVEQVRPSVRSDGIRIERIPGLEVHAIQTPVQGAGA
jgi:hypothetical protein